MAEVDARDLATSRLAYGSTGDWLTHLGGLRKGEGKRRVARAKALTGPLARTREALVAGTVSPGQADLIVAVGGRAAAGGLDPPPRGAVDGPPGRATSTRPSWPGRVGTWSRSSTPTRSTGDCRPGWSGRNAPPTSTATCGSGPTGPVGSGSAAAGRPRTVPSSKPRSSPSPDPNPDPKPDPGSRAEDVDEETGQPCAAGTTRPGRDPREAGARCWDALIALAQHGLTTGRVPETHGTPARLLITLDHHTLLQQLDANGIETRVKGVGTTGDGTDLPPGHPAPAGLRRRAPPRHPQQPPARSSTSDALRRLVTPAQWTALIVRDRHCTFPTCTRPPVMCHAHHLTHWADGGDTSLDNLALLCGRHHRVIHHTPWQIRLNPHDRQPEFKPPPKPGITPEWIRYRPRLE